MPQSVAVIFIHGIGVKDQDYHLPMQQQITSVLPRSLRPFVSFESVYWAAEVRSRQRRYMDAVTHAGHFRDARSRRLVVEGLGDAAAYQKTKKRENAAYYDIQKCVRKAIEKLDDPEHPARPLVFVAHSLGCQIASSFAWDVNTYKQMSAERLKLEDAESNEFADYLKTGSAFRRLSTLAGIVTMGSNQPLFTFMYEPDGVIPITRSRGPSEVPAFPGVELPEVLKTQARWLNYFSKNDLLGYPLKPLHQGYRDEMRLTDIEVASEGYVKRYLWPSPLNAVAAHTGYWKNRHAVKGTARLIRDLITAADDKKQPRFGWTPKKV